MAFEGFPSLWVLLLANARQSSPLRFDGLNVLSGESLVVHQEELDVTDVADEESLVAGGHHVAGLLVGTVSDL